MHALRTSSVPLLIVAVALLGCQTFSRNPAQLAQARATVEGTWTAVSAQSNDPARDPAHIDFHHTAGTLAGQTWRGVYALEGDTLRITDNAPDPAKPRPTALTATANAVVVVFKRSAP